jgi:hypothetical protein
LVVLGRKITDCNSSLWKGLIANIHLVSIIFIQTLYIRRLKCPLTVFQQIYTYLYCISVPFFFSLETVEQASSRCFKEKSASDDGDDVRAGPPVVQQQQVVAKRVAAWRPLSSARARCCCRASWFAAAVAF